MYIVFLLVNSNNNSEVCRINFNYDSKSGF